MELRSLHRTPEATYWRFYQHIGNLRVYPVRTLAHIVKLYGPGSTPTQLDLRKRAIAELQRREAQGSAEAREALQPLSLPNP